MERLTLFSGLIISQFVMSSFIVTSTTKTNESLVTFYKTPLVCNAAPNIGCGSRSKPVLLELEKNPDVKEAWLNRQGTVIAVVWKDKVNTETVVKPIFNENSISYTVLSDDDAASYRKTFHKENLWYRGADVDKLSREEAATIAESSVKFAIKDKLITNEEAVKIKNDVEAYFKKELVIIRTNDQLNDDNQHKFRQAMYNIIGKYIGKERTEKVMELYQQNCEKQCRKDAGCTTPGAKKDCCDK